MTEDQALATTEDFDVSGTAIQAYADRGVVREMGDRLMMLHPAAAKLGKPAMLGLGQLAIMLGANPLPGAGELDVWPDKKSGQPRFNIGVAFFRRRAGELGGVAWRVKPRSMTEEERAEYGIKDGELASICEACSKADMFQALKEGLTADAVWSFFSRIGVGTVDKREFPKTGRPLIWTAQKRAEKDCLNKLFPEIRSSRAPGRQPWEDQIEHLAAVPLPALANGDNGRDSEAVLEEGTALLGRPPEDFEGFGDDGPTTSTTPPEFVEPVILHDDRPDEADPLDMRIFDLIRDANDTMIVEYYTDPGDILQAVRAQLQEPEWTWPHPEDDPAWDTALDAAISYPATQAKANGQDVLFE